jgi:hypothetical protein
MSTSRLLGALLGLTLFGAAAPAEAVVGGTPAPPGRWPWMAALLEASTRDAGWAQYCGGAVIAPRRVLTPAHCVEDEAARDIDVLVGRTRLSERDGRRISVAAVSVHPDFAGGRIPALDAAVLTLAQDAGVPVVSLARPGQDAAWAPGTPAWTMGWGRLNAKPSPGGSNYYADRLRELQQPVQGDDACEGAYGLGWWDLPYRPAWLLCAGVPGDRAGTCYGDSGAPLVVGQPGAWLMVGMDIASDSCAAPGYFDLNVRVDRISGFALGTRLTARPEPASRPRVSGRLKAGARVRCVPGRWHGDRAALTVRWRRIRRGHDVVVGHRGRYRLGKRDAAAGVRCVVTASNRGGRMTAASRPLLPRKAGARRGEGHVAA